MDEHQIKKENNPSEQTIDLKNLFKAFMRGCVQFWWLIAVSALICGVLAFTFKMFTYVPMYKAQSSFTITTNSSNDLSEGNYNFYYNASTAEQLGHTFPYILSSEVLQDSVKEELDVKKINGIVEAQTIQNSNLVTMYCTSVNAKDAKSILEATMKVFPEVSRNVIGETKFNIIDAPAVPDSPFNSPDYKKDTVVGIAIGIVLSLIFVFIYALFKKTVQNAEELNQVINLECLSTLPTIKQKKHKKSTSAVKHKERNPWFSENMEKLRLRVLKSLDEDNKKVLLVTSTVAGEGKSLISINLAYKLARHNKKVLLIDADLRKQELAKRLNVETSFSFNDLEDKKSDLKNCLAYDEKNKLYFLGGNSPAKDITKILSNGFKDAVDALREEMDYIIIDTPPCSALEDAFIISDAADAVLYVVRQDKAVKRKVIETIANLDVESNSKVIGYVFNGVEGVFGAYGNYGGSYSRYGYGYGHYGYGHYGYGGYSRYGNYGKYGYHSYGYGYGERTPDKKK